MSYLIELARAIFGQRGVWWWLSLSIAYVFGFGIWENYPKIRDGISGQIGWSLMPEVAPFWWIAIPLLIWIIGALAHKEVMRQLYAARIRFDPPYQKHAPLTNRRRDQMGTIVEANYRFHLWMAKINIRNSPYRGDQGTDVIEAWIEVEIFDSNFRPIASWQYPRWEENRKPGYGDNPIDHYPDNENVRNLTANGKPHIVCIAFKPIDEADAYPMRGRDQLKLDWKSPDLRIPPGSYFVRLRVQGKGLARPAEQVVALTNGGVGRGFEVSLSNKKIGTWWP